MNTRDDAGIQLTKKQAIVVIFALLFINILFLMMGVLIGRGDLKWSQQPGDQVAAVPTDPPENVAASIEDELSVFSEEVEDKRRDPIDPSYLEEGAEPITAEKPPEPEVAEPEVKKPEPKEPETGVVSKPLPKKDVAPTPIAAPATVFWIQLTASGDPAKAQEMKKKAAGMGYQTVIVKEGGYHKVRVGPYAARASAGRDLKKLNGKLGTKGWIVTKP
ncbi:MAG: SPOR domain-containing protein [Acidobacteriota bacterium]|nr:SPOR domain-containing protein [Acidobacteriota bacterium]